MKTCKVCGAKYRGQNCPVCETMLSNREQQTSEQPSHEDVGQFEDMDQYGTLS